MRRKPRTSERQRRDGLLHEIRVRSDRGQATPAICQLTEVDEAIDCEDCTA